MIVVVAGCLPQSAPDLPADFLDRAFGAGATFTVLQAPSAERSQDIVAELRTRSLTMFSGRAVPIFGIVDCHGVPKCNPGPYVDSGQTARTVWVVTYPDCTDGREIGWAVVDTEVGLEEGYFWDSPCPQE